MFEWLTNLDWSRLVPEVVGKFIGFGLGVAFSWFLLFRRQLQALARLKTGESNAVLFQAHYLSPVDKGEDDDFVLLFRNIAPAITIDALYENEAARKIVQEFAAKTTLKEPILPTSGTLGFEVLNDAFGHLAGHLAGNPFERETWLFVMTCEDGQVVRRRCVRCFLVRPGDLERFADWIWCRRHVRCEQPWHWYRIVALHQIALAWKQEEADFSEGGKLAKEGEPLVDDHASHRRVRRISAGVYPQDFPVGAPVKIPWDDHEAELRRLAKADE